jgi:transcriptional regulator with XRE-family HTH domain
MTRDELMKLIQQRVEQTGTQAALARELGITAVYLGDVLSGKREPGPKILDALGIRRVITYVKVGEKK